jgi:hypothetical protein
MKAQTMTKLNCWEYKKCGREPGGALVTKMGLCPATIEVRVTGINAGSNGGRVCWVIPGTFCGWQLNGTYADKLANCHNCKFYKLVGIEEGSSFDNKKEILDRLRDERGNLSF